MHSKVAAAQSEVQRVLDCAILDGSEDAVQVAAYLNGELIVDAWSAPAARPVDGYSLFPIFSTGKGIAATAVHRLVERGTLSWDEPIAQHWPEFAAKGKGGITLRHVLNHTAGLPMMPDQGHPAQVCDWETMCAFLADSAPLHPPGARRHYHAITYSWLLGETARRADGRDFGRIINDEVCRPLGIESLFFGLPDALLPLCVNAKIASPTSPPPATTSPPPPPDPVAQRAIPLWIGPLENWINRNDIRRACLPSSNGFGNARALARHYAALIGTGVDGVRLLADATVAAATRWDALVDAAVPGDGRWGMGYSLQGPDHAPGVVFGHDGYGGSTGFADVRYALAVAVVKQRMGGPVTGNVVETIRRCVGAR